MHDNCLIVINNFEGVDINPSIELPVILRQFELASGKVEHSSKYLEEYDETEIGDEIVDYFEWIWIPKEMVPKRNGNFSIDLPKKEFFISKGCDLFTYVYSIWPSDKHSGLCLCSSSFNFILTSKPWQCEITIDLFIPDILLRLGKSTSYFSSLTQNRWNTFPSLRPSIYMLFYTQLGVSKEEKMFLGFWTLKKSHYFSITRYRADTANHVQIVGGISCEHLTQKIRINSNCIIKRVDIVYPCPECNGYINIYPMNLNYLPFDQIAAIDKIQKYIAFPGKFTRFHADVYSLARLITYYADKEAKLVKFPLKNLQKLKKSSDKLELLAFAYASIYIEFLGNVSLRRAYFGSDFLYSCGREITIMDTEDAAYNTTLRVKNVFGRLHFVSCGSRGIKPFQFIEFLSVFEWQVWVFILLSIGLLSYTTYKCSIGLLNRTLSFFKVLVEQGDPFPNNFDNKKQMRFLMIGILLAGLVISNAFKSENVYKIVLPRGQISYYNIDELIEDNVTVYTRIQSFSYLSNYPLKCSYIQTTYFLKYEFGICKDKSFRVFGYAELESLESVPNETAKITIYSKMHPKSIQLLAEPLEFLDPLVRVRLINFKAIRLLVFGSSLKERFLQKQNDVITNDLKTCNKTAWALPNYLAQTVHRSLKKYGKHSDVSSNAYTFPEITFSYRDSYVPSSILERISFIPNTGLLEWWPNFINRSDYIPANDNIVPKSPNMSGNILVIFVFLCGGYSIAILCIISELSGKLFGYYKIGWICFFANLRVCVSKLKTSKIKSNRVVALKIN